MTTEFGIGVLSSMVAAGLLYFGRFQLGFLLNAVFRNYFPNVSGKYLLTDDAEKRGARSPDPHQKAYVTLEQTANLIRGRSEVYSGDELTAKIYIQGDVSPSRIIRFKYESESKDHHHFGVGLFKISHDGKTLRGHSTVLCASCEDTTTVVEVLKKLSDKE